MKIILSENTPSKNSVKLILNPFNDFFWLVNSSYFFKACFLPSVAKTIAGSLSGDKCLGSSAGGGGGALGLCLPLFFRSPRGSEKWDGKTTFAINKQIKKQRELQIPDQIICFYIKKIFL